MYLLMETFDESFNDQSCKGVFGTHDKAHEKMTQLYESKLTEKEENDTCEVGCWDARIEDCYGNGWQWRIVEGNWG